MFPDYMNDMLRQASCGHCNAKLTLTDIAVVGIRRPEDFEAFYGDPVFVMAMDCPNCGQRTNHTIRLPVKRCVEGIFGFGNFIEVENKNKKPPLNIPGLGKKPVPR